MRDTFKSQIIISIISFSFLILRSGDKNKTSKLLSRERKLNEQLQSIAIYLFVVAAPNKSFTSLRFFTSTRYCEVLDTLSNVLMLAQRSFLVDTDEMSILMIRDKDSRVVKFLR